MAESLTTPATLPQTIAENGDATVIPATNDQTEGKASIAYGFPPLTSTPITDGGKMVRRADFNGLFNLLSQYALFTQNGGLFTFNQSVSDAIGGYPLGAQLIYTDTDGNCHIVKSLIPNNTYNFINDPTYIDGLKWGYAFIDTNKSNTFTDSQDISTGDVAQDIINIISTNIPNNSYTPTDFSRRDIVFRANNDSILGYLRCSQDSNGNNALSIRAIKNVGGSDVQAVLFLQVDSNGIAYANLSPSTVPASNDKSTKIPTTQWISDLLKGNPSLTEGWAYLGNGIGLEWGLKYTTSSGATVTLPKQFDDNRYLVVANHDVYNSATIVDSNINTYDHTTTNFKIKSDSSTSYPFSWFAIGKMTLSDKPN